VTDRQHMDRAMAERLDQILTAQVEHDSRAGSDRPAASRSRPTTWVTVAVGVVVVLLAVVAIRTAGTRQSSTLPATSASGSATAGPTASPTPTGSPEVLGTAALLKKLPKPDYGRLLHTWTERDSASTGPFDPDGDVVVIAGVCNGGGAVSWTDVTGTAHTLSCRGLRIQQPGWRFNLGGDGEPTETKDPVKISVRILSGTPKFVLRMWAVDARVLRSGFSIAATSKQVPETLRTCASGDLAVTGTLEEVPTRNGGIVTVTNASSSDCAVRSWPILRYLDADGQQIGDLGNQSLDSSEGSLNRFQEFPPARLEAGGKGYLIVDLQTERRLAADDRQTEKENAKQAATPSPSPNPIGSLPVCDPVEVAALQLTISGSTVQVPVQTEPVTAACRNTGFAFGVNPVVAFRPSGR